MTPLRFLRRLTGGVSTRWLARLSNPYVWLIVLLVLVLANRFMVEPIAKVLPWVWSSLRP